MPVMLTLPVACAALACAPADAVMSAETVAMPSVNSSQVAISVEPSGAKMVAFDGGRDFLAMSRRLRVWRTGVEFDMTVDAQGEATECQVVDRFRKTYVNMKLCEVVMAHTTFEPARNEHNEAVEGTYRASLSYAELREELE